MYQLPRSCTYCEQGPLGFVMCSDGRTVALVCDDCDATWLDPADVEDEEPLFPGAPDYFVEGREASINFLQGARWATLEELRARGMHRVAIPGERGG